MSKAVDAAYSSVRKHFWAVKRADDSLFRYHSVSFLSNLPFYHMRTLAVSEEDLFLLPQHTTLTRYFQQYLLFIDATRARSLRRWR